MEARVSERSGRRGVVKCDLDRSVVSVRMRVDEPGCTAAPGADGAMGAGAVVDEIPDMVRGTDVVPPDVGVVLRVIMPDWDIEWVKRGRAGTG